MGDFHITVKITFLLDSQQHPETEKVNMDFPLLLFHPPPPTFFFFPKQSPLFRVADREACVGRPVGLR